MRQVVWALIALSALGFVIAVVLGLTGRTLLTVAPEGYSRGCTNLAVLAIAVLLAWEKKAGES